MFPIITAVDREAQGLDQLLLQSLLLVLDEPEAPLAEVRSDDCCSLHNYYLITHAPLGQSSCVVDLLQSGVGRSPKVSEEVPGGLQQHEQ